MYVDRIVIFIDILGFKELSITDSGFDEVKRVYDRFNQMIKNANRQFVSSVQSHAFAAARKTKQDSVKLEDIFKPEEAEILFFSDSVVWTYRIDKLPPGVEFWHVLLALCGCLNVLLSVLFADKILVRGGVSIGKLHIDGNKIYGPALVRAYELERRAIYPRIVYDSDIIEVRLDQRFRILFHFSIEEFGKGLYAHNYFGTIRTLIHGANGEGKLIDKEILQLVIRTFVEPIEISVMHGIKHPDPKVRAKYDWMRSQLLSIKGLSDHYDLTKIEAVK